MSACPYCGKPNQPAATFCIHCGEPTDEASLAELAPRNAIYDSGSPRTGGGGGEQGSIRRPLSALLLTGNKLELYLGLLLIFAVVAFAWYFSAQQESRSAHYRAGNEAMSSLDFGRAAAEFSAAEDYRDASRRLGEARNRLSEVNANNKTAFDLRTQGKWWMAAASLRLSMSAGTVDPQVAQVLQYVRLVNGHIVYGMSGPQERQGGVYVSWADGGDANRAPQTDGSTDVLAVSTDARWVLFAPAAPPGSTPSELLIYNTVDHTVRVLDWPSGITRAGLGARFAPDSQKLWLESNGAVFWYGLDANRPLDAPLEPVIWSREGNGVSLLKQVEVEYVAATGQSTILMHAPGVKAAIPAGTEEGVIDGASTSSDGRWLLYRTCPPAEKRHSQYCSLKIVDTSLRELHANTIASIPANRRGYGGSFLYGEFTRDGKHVLILERYNGETEARIYTLEVGRFQVVGERATGDIAGMLASGPLLEQGIPGLTYWQGPNSLTFTTETVPIVEARGDRDQRFLARAHWVTISPSDAYTLFFTGGKDGSEDGGYKLYATPLTAREKDTKPRPPALLLNTRRAPKEWVPNTYFLPDGQTMLTTEPPQPGPSRGLYAYDLQTGQVTLAMPGVKQTWRPGFSTLQPEFPSVEPMHQP